MTKRPSDFDFPQAMQELESLNDYFQSTELDLTTALDKFQHAQQLIKDCQTYLDQLETKFKEITPRPSDDIINETE